MRKLVPYFVRFENGRQYDKGQIVDIRIDPDGWVTIYLEKNALVMSNHKVLIEQKWEEVDA